MSSNSRNGIEPLRRNRFEVGQSSGRLVRRSARGPSPSPLRLMLSALLVY